MLLFSWPYYSVILRLITSVYQALTNQSLALSQAEYQTNAVAASSALMGWYNQTNGLFQTTDWWNAASAITTLAMLTKVNPQMEFVTKKIWNNTYYNAQKHNLYQERATPDSIGPSNSSTPGQHEPTIRSFNKHNTYHKRPVRSIREKRALLAEWVMEPKGFLNGFYDDEGWWALAWLNVYDISRNKDHLLAATDIFNDMVSTGYNATCGGIWWNKKRNYNSAISNELFLSVAAHLATRVDNKDYYVNWAKRQWDWFQKSGLINKDYNINDGLDTDCKNNDGVVWSYNQGVILGALSELSKADRNNTYPYLATAKKIALAAKSKLADKNGILHDHREPNLGNDGNQFKGVFVRNLWQLYETTQEPWMKTFLLDNAKAVWRSGRNTTTNRMGPVWSGPYYPATAATHSSALDVLVAAAGVA
ncbi:Six-hairpin glycosidase [Microthyrium microscopicum]|uniref:Six-hairpin glycosidase n=1 Tax=Microthyrium microscopicum TaxID=703497 RepID=A0A6A6UI16_9PEZI|nr:Six-hairpin glycosidase [Microthyrium microscopicum]